MARKKMMMKKCSSCKKKMMHKKETPKERNKVEKVMKEYKQGKLHSGSKKGPKVRSRKQAVAIALSEARKRK